MPFSTQRPQRISFYNQDSLPFINEPRARAWDVHPKSTLILSLLREGVDGRALTWRGAPVHIDDPLPELICFATDTSSFEHIELPAQLLYYFLWGNKQHQSIVRGFRKLCIGLLRISKIGTKFDNFCSYSNAYIIFSEQNFLFFQRRKNS